MTSFVKYEEIHNLWNQIQISDEIARFFSSFFSMNKADFLTHIVENYFGV